VQIELTWQYFAENSMVAAETESSAYLPQIMAIDNNKLSLDQAYSLLGFDSHSVPDEKEISNRYRELMLKYHPDRKGPDGAEIACKLNQAKDMVRIRHLCVRQTS
jgi:DnaJ-class molecular chaperone